eukprot:XP_001708489.1 Hypothetical protein GL50803_24170 [Giardia lamblia ATCC 50803]
MTNIFVYTTATETQDSDRTGAIVTRAGSNTETERMVAAFLSARHSTQSVGD